MMNLMCTHFSITCFLLSLLTIICTNDTSIAAFTGPATLGATPSNTKAPSIGSRTDNTSPLLKSKTGDDDDENSSSSNEGEYDIWLPSQDSTMANRMERLIKEQEMMDRFAQTGGELEELRSDITNLKDNLKWALATDNIHRIIDLRAAIEEAEERDPEIVYSRALQMIVDASKMDIRQKYETITKYTKEAKAARQFIPRLNLEGLWVGNFGEHGSELVNVTYSGDTLIATKVTGDKRVPRGEVSFKTDLGPKLREDGQSPESSKPLVPIQLTGSAASKWGARKLERYPGEGQVSGEGFKDSKFVEGQFIMFDGYFSFLWVPNRHHVFFSRPKPELTLHLMRDILSEEDESQNMIDHIKRCYEKDISEAFRRPSMKEEGLEPFRRIHREEDLVSVMEERDGVIFENRNTISLSFALPFQTGSNPFNNNLSFWAVQKWRNYIDNVMKDDNGNTGHTNQP